VLAILSAGSVVYFSRNSRASADVLIVPTTSQVTLDPRFQTTNGSQASTPASQRQALINLVSSQSLAERVVRKAGVTHEAQELIDRTSVASTSDLLQITVSDPDPATALRLAQAWGQEYEGFVAEVYTRNQGPTQLLDAEVKTAQDRYDASQSELERFLSDGKLLTTQALITSTNGLLLSSSDAQQMRYADYLTRTRELDLLIADAQTLRDQASAQQSAGFADSFATLLLRARTVDHAAPSFQISLGDLNAGATSARDMAAGLDQFIAVLKRRRDELAAQADAIAGAIVGDGGVAGLDSATRQRYTNQLAALNSTFEQLRAQRVMLTQKRDVARDSLLLLLRKHDEQEIARSSPQIEVRFVSASLEARPSALGRMALFATVAGVGGLILGALLAIFLDVLSPALRRLSAADAAQPAGARADLPADRPIPGD
jgi:uncharacterized protein involved in exopolysaccharide biosynthesis